MERIVSRRQDAKASRSRAVRPSLEGLEARMLLYSTTGDLFQYGSRITWSIVPDGTSLGGVSSNLISTLNSQLGSTANWLPAVQDAFAQWESYANINLVQVPDSGQPIGSGNIQQDSPQFGDIRIGGYVQGQNVLGFALLPPGANGGSDSGDVFLNTGLTWHVGTDYDLETVMVHEIGHALGLGHSASPTAVMFPYYSGVEQSPNADDVAGIRAAWGARQEDPVEQLNGNLTLAKAADVTGFITPSNGQAYLPGLDVASTSESYWFKLTTPANSSNVLTAQVQSSGLSELSPRVQLYNAAGAGLAQASAPANAYGATINATITNATPNTTYYVRVLGSTSGASGVGAYALTINAGFGYIGTAPPPNTTVLAQPDQGGGALPELGGANNHSNTPRDLPDRISIGKFASQGDFLMASASKANLTKLPKIQVKAPHPTHPTPKKAPKSPEGPKHLAKK